MRQYPILCCDIHCQTSVLQWPCDALCAVTGADSSAILLLIRLALLSIAF